MSQTPTIDYRLIFALMNGKVSTALRQCLNQDFIQAGIEISGNQWDVLLAISANDTCTQQTICEATSFSKPTISRIIDTLEEEQLVHRRKARVDFRNNYLTLTIKGLELVNRAQSIAVQTLIDSLRGLSKMDIIIAQQSLNTVLENLNHKKELHMQQHSEQQHRISQQHRRNVRRMHNGG